VVGGEGISAAGDFRYAGLASGRTGRSTTIAAL
jgi:hypothetical protein